MGTPTTNLSLYKPDKDETGWDALVNATLDLIDTALGLNFDSTGDLVNGSDTEVAYRDGNTLAFDPAFTFDNISGSIHISGTISVGGGAFSLPKVDGTADQIMKTDGSGNLSWTAGAMTHNGLSGLQGGAADEYYHLTAAEYTNWQLFSAETAYMLLDGTRPLTGAWDAGSFEIKAETFESDIATGTAPFTIASTTLNANLNADLLDGLEGNQYSVVAGSASIVTVGTIGTGVWEGTVIGSGFIADDFLKNDGDIGTGVFDFGGADSFEIPNGSSGTTDVTGEIFLDTDGDGGTNFSGPVVQIYTGSANEYLFPVALPLAASQDNYIMTYDAAGKTVQWEAGGGAALTSYQEDLTIDADGDITLTLSNTPDADSTVNLYVNGKHQQQGSGKDYTISSATITYLERDVELKTTDDIVATYLG